jgi:hypothetical protein
LPEGGYFTIGGCNLHISTQNWLCGTNSISVNGLLYNGGENNNPADPNEPVDPEPTTMGGQHIWNGIIYALAELLQKGLNTLLPDHDTRIDLLLDRGRYVLPYTYTVTSNLMPVVIKLVMGMEITYWVFSFAVKTVRIIF